MKSLLESALKMKLSVYRLRIVCVDIYKTINKLNSEFRLKENKRLVTKQFKVKFETR